MRYCFGSSPSSTKPNSSRRKSDESCNYGRALDLEARYPLAADVFKTIVDSFAGPDNVDLVIEAATMLGAAAYVERLESV